MQPHIVPDVCPTFPPHPSPVVLEYVPHVQLTLRRRMAFSSHTACGNNSNKKNSSHTESANSSHGGTSRSPIARHQNSTFASTLSATVTQIASSNALLRGYSYRIRRLRRPSPQCCMARMDASGIGRSYVAVNRHRAAPDVFPTRRIRKQDVDRHIHLTAHTPEARSVSTRRSTDRLRENHALRRR